MPPFSKKVPITTASAPALTIFFAVLASLIPPRLDVGFLGALEPLDRDLPRDDAIDDVEDELHTAFDIDGVDPGHGVEELPKRPLVASDERGIELLPDLGRDLLAQELVRVAPVPLEFDGDDRGDPQPGGSRLRLRRS